MSFELYTNWWIAAKKDLEDLHRKDEIMRTKLPIVPDRSKANYLLGGFYAKYSMLVQQLNTILDQTAQAQRRVTMRKLVDSAAIRLKELYNELRHIDFSEIHYIDDTLVELKLVPYDIELLHPLLFYPRYPTIEDMWNRIKKGERLYDPPPPPPPEPEEGEEGAVKEEAPPPPPEEKKKEKKTYRPKVQLSNLKVLTPEEMEIIKRKELFRSLVQLIQNHERARQHRLYCSDHERILIRKHAAAALMAQKNPPPEIDPETLAVNQIKIARRWRGHSDRLYLKRREDERRLLIGMTVPSWKSNAVFETMEKNMEKRRTIVDKKIREFIDANLQEKVRVLRIMGPGLFEDIGDEIREWFHDWYDRARNFDKYPPVEKGGSVLVVRGETMTPEEWIEEVEKKRRQKAKGVDKAKLKAEKLKAKKAEQDKKKKEKERLKKEAQAKKKRRQDVTTFKLEFDDALSNNLYKEGQTDYHKLYKWHERNPMDNEDENVYMDYIYEEKCCEVQLEVRVAVDEMMRLELDLLKDALERDRLRGKKGKKKKKKKGKGKGKKKGKKGKKGKKDPLAHRTTEDLFQELVDNGIIRQYPKTPLSLYKGDFSYKNFEMRNASMDPPATLGDIRQAVVMNCILPLGVESTAVRHKSVIICGPPQTGKHLLANAIFTETHSVLFDLSPAIWAGKYEGKKGMQDLVNIINKMTKILQPSIIFFDGAEKPFYKKIPAEEKGYNPKEIGKVLMKKIIKPITANDRVMVLGITNKPWAANAKMKKAFEKAILIPRPDYNSIYLYWHEALMKYHGVDRNIDISCLTKLTTLFTFPVIQGIIEKVLNTERLIQLKYKPLRQEELYEPFVNLEPTTEKIWKKYVKWYQGTAVGKLRKKFNKLNDAKRENEARAKEKGK